MKLSFVIPCYRSEQTIEAVVAELKGTMKRRDFDDYEIVMVSDHSPDGVYAKIENLCKSDSVHAKGVELARNFGQHSALMAGYAIAEGDVVVSLDDDGQTPVNEVWSLVDKITDGGYDVVYASYKEKKHSFGRNLGSKVNDWMTCWLLDKPRKLKVTSYFAAKRFVIDEVLRYQHAFPYVIGLVLRATRNVCNVPVTHRDRSIGASGYSLAKLIGLWLNGFTAFSVKPLRLASFVGALCTVIGFGLGLWAVANKLFINPHAPLGYSSLMAAVLFTGGVLMLILSMIGEYIGRIYICINRSPQYVISKKTKNV